MPDALSDIVRARTGPSLGCIAADDYIPSVVFKEPHCFGEEAGSNEVEEACAYDQEELELGNVAATARLSAWPCV